MTLLELGKTIESKSPMAPSPNTSGAKSQNNDWATRKAIARFGPITGVKQARLALGFSPETLLKGPKPQLMECLAGNKKVSARVYGQMIIECLKKAENFAAGSGLLWIQMATAGKRPYPRAAVNYMSQMIERGGRARSDRTVDLPGSQVFAQLLMRHQRVARHPRILKTVDGLVNPDPVITMLARPAAWVETLKQILDEDMPHARDWWAVRWYVPVVSEEHWDEVDPDEWVWLKEAITTAMANEIRSKRGGDISWWQSAETVWWAALNSKRLGELGQRGQARILANLAEKEDRMRFLKILRKRAEGR